MRNGSLIENIILDCIIGLDLVDFKFSVVIFKKEIAKLPFLIKIKFAPILNAFNIKFFSIGFFLNKCWHLYL